MEGLGACLSRTADLSRIAEIEILLACIFVLCYFYLDILYLNLTNFNILSHHIIP